MHMNKYEKIASRYLFTDMAIKNLELDLRHLDNSPCKIKDPYYQAMGQLISTAIKERKRLKQLMYKHKLKVKHIKSNRLYSTYKYNLTANVHELSSFNQILKKHAKEIIKELFT